MSPALALLLKSHPSYSEAPARAAIEQRILKANKFADVLGIDLPMATIVLKRAWKAGPLPEEGKEENLRKRIDTNDVEHSYNRGSRFRAAYWQEWNELLRELMCHLTDNSSSNTRRKTVKISNIRAEVRE